MDEERKQAEKDSFGRWFRLTFMDKDDVIYKYDDATTNKISEAIFGQPLINKYDFMGATSRNVIWLFNQTYVQEENRYIYNVKNLGIRIQDIEIPRTPNYHKASYDILKQSLKEIVYNPLNIRIEQFQGKLPKEIDRKPLNEQFVKDMSECEFSDNFCEEMQVEEGFVDIGYMIMPLKDREIRGFTIVNEDDAYHISKAIFGEPLTNDGLLLKSTDGTFYALYLWLNQKGNISVLDVRPTGINIKDVNYKSGITKDDKKSRDDNVNLVEPLSYEQYQQALVRICLEGYDMTVHGLGNK